MSWQMATGKARSNSSRRPMWASETRVAVTVVPMLAPITMGIALARGSGFSGAATRATTMEVVTEELCMTVVASRPTMRPINGLEVAAKKLSMKSCPISSKPSPSPLTPRRNTNSRATTLSARWTTADPERSGLGVVAGKAIRTMLGVLPFFDQTAGSAPQPIRRLILHAGDSHGRARTPAGDSRSSRGDTFPPVEHAPDAQRRTETACNPVGSRHNRSVTPTARLLLICSTGEESSAWA